jgi:hypothetical protein
MRSACHQPFNNRLDSRPVAQHSYLDRANLTRRQRRCNLRANDIGWNVMNRGDLLIGLCRYRRDDAECVD